MSQTQAAPTAVGEESHRTKGLLRLTMACNERCPFCNVPQEEYDRLTPPEAETFAELEAFVAEGAGTLTISGGEPTLLRKRLVRLVRTARERGIPFVELQTNAVLIDEAYAAELAEAGLTSAFVSFLSHVPEHHDTLAGLPGAFDKCLRGMDALLAHGVRVTLNPVTARLTQELVADYVDFVAERLPGVRFISMSAVQPHGRARHDADTLLPDYAVLSRTIRQARERAAVHGIELVNPYCGLPACIGWDDGLECSVEAFEARGGGWRVTPGIDNVGNKSHGAPCQRCALRTRCGGAWHAYWELRGGSGIQAPVTTVEPWFEDAHGAPGQEVVVASGGPQGFHLDRVDASGAPTVWLWTDRLRSGDAGHLLRAHVTDLALELDSVDPAALREPLTEVRRVLAAGRRLQPQTRLHVHLGLRVTDATNVAAVLRVGALAAALEVDGFRILSGVARWRRVAERIAMDHPTLDVAAVDARELPQGVP